MLKASKHGSFRAFGAAHALYIDKSQNAHPVQAIKNAAALVSRGFQQGARWPVVEHPKKRKFLPYRAARRLPAVGGGWSGSLPQIASCYRRQTSTLHGRGYGDGS